VETFAERTAHPRELADNAQFRELVALLSTAEVTLETLRQYVLGDNWPLSCAALAALRERSDRAQLTATLLRELLHLKPWPIYFALEYLASLEERPPVGAPLVAAPAWWANNIVIAGLFNDHFVRREALGDQATFGDSLARPGVNVAAVEPLLKRMDHRFAGVLLEEISQWRLASFDREFLRSFGRLWSVEETTKLLIDPPAWRRALDSARNAITANPRRSVLVTGEGRVGKTSFVRLLSAALMKQGWTVFEAGAAELMAGQSYIGELEGRIQRLVRELSGSRRIVWYIPDLLALASSGTHKGQSASILDQILPALSSANLVVLLEAAPAGATRVLQARPALRGVLETVRLMPATDEEARELGKQFAAVLATESGLRVAEDAIQTGAHLVRQYLSHVHLPGALIDLLKLSAQRCLAAGEDALTSRTLLATLSQVTGLPEAMLDDRERLDMAAVRAFFALRVIGQDEAVNTIVDRIAMLKAGLTDPGRPLGVFLFAGPTGTGKTELAKSLAEHLFSSTERLIRLDMSELQYPGDLRKLIGDPGEGPDAASLIQRVRKQPFSVVLLDEFEKSHTSIWDLFLQVFDDGRLSDANGNTADFRHCIIILTSNLGATLHQGRALGFVSGTSSFAPDQVLRTVTQTFRPEFVNRLDRVIVFRPLSRDLMREILRKELRNVLQRRGLRNREWAVEWEDSAQEFLLDKGFTPELGARPLRRAIDEHVLAPLATVMVEHRVPEGDQFLFVRSDGTGIQVEFVDPDDDREPAVREGEPVIAAGGNAHAAVNLATMILQPRGSAAEQTLLETACLGIERRLASADWELLNQKLVLEMSAPDFWSRADRKRIMARVALIDRVRAASSTVRALRERLRKSAHGSSGLSRELVSRLALQVHLVEHGIEDVFADAPIEVAVAVEPTLDSEADGAARDWRDRILTMYREWARRRRMQLQAIGEFVLPAPGAQRAVLGTPALGRAATARSVLLVSGFGAYRILSGEAGLHVLETGTGSEVTERWACRVRVVPIPLELDVSTNARALADLLAGSGSAGQIVRRYRIEPSPLVRDARQGWRTGKLDAILGGDFDLMGQVLSVA
jgi:ATP-dependent Clp protease ATP-binding subunit ClpC